MDFGLTLRRLVTMTYFALTLETVSASGIRSTNDMMQMNSLDLSTIFEEESSMEAFLRLENCFELKNEDANYSETNSLTFSRTVPSKKRSLTYGAIREAMNANTENEEADLAINHQFSPEEGSHNELQDQLDRIKLEDAKTLCNIVLRQMNDLGLDPRKNPALNIFPGLKEHLDVREYVSHPEDDREITTSEKERLDRMKKRSMLKLDLVGDTENNGKNTIREHEKEILKAAKSYYSDIEALMKKVCEMGERLRNEQYLKEKDTAIKDFCRLKDEIKDQFDSEVFDLKNFRMIFDNLMVYKDRFAKLEQDSAMGKSNRQKLNDLCSISGCSKAINDQTHATECDCEDLERNKLILGQSQGEK